VNMVHGPCTWSERGHITSQYFLNRYRGYEVVEHENDPSTQIHYSFCCPTPCFGVNFGWILGQFEVKL